MPDIDMDFGDTRRGEVVDYVRRKYGDDHVAQIVTFGTMAARACHPGRGPGAEHAPTPRWTLWPSWCRQGQARCTSPWTRRCSSRKQLADMYDDDEQVKKLIDTAMALEGMPRHASTHAAGVVITKQPVYEYVPLATERRRRGHASTS